MSKEPKKVIKTKKKNKNDSLKLTGNLDTLLKAALQPKKSEKKKK